MSKNTGTSELINYFDLGVNGDVGISGNLTLSTIVNATVDTDRFLVSDSGVIKYRTGAELLSDIGGQGALTNPVTGTGTTNYISKFTGSTTLADSLIYDNGSTVLIGTTTAPTPVTGVSFPLSITSSQATRVRIDSSRGAPNYANAGVGLYASGVQKWSFAHYSTDSGANYDFTIYNDALTSSAILVKGSNSNVLIGSTVDNGAKLQVSGRTRINAGSLSAAFGFDVDVNSTFAFGSTNGRRTGTITRDSGDKPGLQFGYDATDNTGIIAGATQALGAGIDFYTFNGSAWGNRMRIASSGNVGIGTNAPDSYTGTASTRVLAVGTTSGNNGVNVISGTTSTGSYMFSDSGGNDRGGLIYFHTADLMTLTTAGSERMRITSSGNLLVGGTSDNGARLQVSGNATITGSTNQQLVLDFTTASGGFTWQSFRLNGTNRYRIFGNTDNSFTLYSDILSANVLSIASTGAANFSSSVTANTLLTVNTPASGSGVIFRHVSGTNNPGLFIETVESSRNVRLTASGSSVSGQLLQLGAEGNAGVLNIGGSNVGIGTASPNIYNLTNTRNLTLVNDAGYGVIASVGSSGNGGEIDFGNSSIRHAAIASLDGSNLGFYTNGSNSGTGVTERMRITSDGYLRMASGSGGIQFNGDTAAANALDDYEEGTWTPTINQGGGGALSNLTYSLQRGLYVKIGSVVHYWITLNFNADAFQTLGRIYLPFNVDNSSYAGNQNYASPSFGNAYFINLGTGGTMLGGYYQDNYIRMHSSGNDTDQLTPSTSEGTMTLRLEGIYRTA